MREDVLDALDTVVQEGTGAVPPFISFAVTSFATSPVCIGTVLGVVDRVALAIDTPFDQPCTFEIGPLAAPAELMAGSDSNRLVAATYTADTDHEYAVATDLYLTLIAPGTVPTAGAGRVFIYVD